MDHLFGLSIGHMGLLLSKSVHLQSPSRGRIFIPLNFCHIYQKAQPTVRYKVYNLRSQEMYRKRFSMFSCCEIFKMPSINSLSFPMHTHTHLFHKRNIHPPALLFTTSYPIYLIIQYTGPYIHMLYLRSRFR